MKYPYLLLLLASFSADAATVVSAGYSTPTSITVAPGQITTFFVSGIGASLTGPVRATTVPLPTSLGGISATLNGLAIPMVAVEPIATCRSQTLPGCGFYTAITVQIPFELRAICPGSGQIGDILPASVPIDTLCEAP